MDLSEVGNCLGDDDQPVDQVVRPLANYPPSLWGDRFSSFSLDNELLQRYTNEVESQKEEVKDMLVEVGGKREEKMILINTLERLGVSYLFEEEIEYQLEQMFADFNDRDYDLFTVALHFRIFRQHGYKMSCDVFNKFRDCNGDFKKSLCNDAMGMLSLYEAVFLKISGEEILDEALAFTKSHLQSQAPHLSPVLGEQVMHALTHSIHRHNIPRAESRYYISVYEKDDSSRSSRNNGNLLRLAKLDFNRVQLVHQDELSHISRWWKDIGSKFPYTKDRIVECYLWTVAVYYEPHFSDARIMLAKTTALVSILDDTYDAYGTIDELKTFTDAIQRWDPTSVHVLPDYMKILFKAFLDLFDEFDQKLTDHGRSYRVNHAREAIKEQARYYYTEAVWLKKEGYVPPFDEYLKVGLVTCTCLVLTVVSFLGMGEAIANDEAFNWALNKPKVFVAAATITRLIDDRATYEVEKKRGQIVTGIECYMKQYGVSKDKAVEDFNRKIENAWEDLNEEFLRPTPISMQLLKRFLNFARMMEVTYSEADGYTHPEVVLKDIIVSLFINPIPI